MKARAKGELPPARERFGGARAAAAVAGALSGAGAAAVHLAASPPDPGLRLGELWLAAAGAGGWAGWSLVGLGLGKGLAMAVIRGVGAAGFALVLFCLGAGMRAMAVSMSYIRFTDAAEALYFAVQRAMAVAGAIGVSPALAAAALGGVATALAAEGLHAFWRWRGAEADATGEARAIPATTSGSTSMATTSAP